MQADDQDTIAKLPTREPVRRHSWNDKFTVAAGRSGSEETHRVCADCGLIKITAHPPRERPYRLWETRFGERWRGDATPPCDGGGL